MLTIYHLVSESILHRFLRNLTSIISKHLSYQKASLLNILYLNVL